MMRAFAHPRTCLLNHHLFATLVVLMLTVGLHTHAQAESALDTRQILDKVREALGYEHLQQHTGIVRLEGSGEYCEVPGESRLFFTPSGRFRLDLEGHVGQTFAFDGDKGWMLDWTGMPRPLELEQLETTQACLWVATGRFLADDGPFTISLLHDESDDNHVTLLLKRRSGLLEGRLRIDRATWLPREFLWRSMEGTDRLQMTDYREFKGFRMPFVHTLTSGWGNVTEYNFQRIAGMPPSARDPFATVTEVPQDVEFYADAPNELDLRRTQGLLMVHTPVNGQDVGWFIFDTCGSAMIITPSAGDKANMPAFGKAHAVGIGGTADVRFRLAESYQIGPMTVKDLLFGELDLSFLMGMFSKPIAGIIGYDILARCVAEVDTVEGRVALYDPNTYTLASGKWQELLINHGHPHVRAKFEGDREGVFRVDTGNPGALMVHAPAVEKYRLLDNRETASCKIGGAGGFSPGRSGSLEWFELAGHRAMNPPALFSLADTGSMTSQWVAGTIGMDLMRPFRIVLDCPHKRIAFVKR